MKKAEEIVEIHLTAKGCKCDVMDKTKQYEACLNAVNEALNMHVVNVTFKEKDELSFIDWKYFATGIKEDKQWLINDKKLNDKQLREIYKIMKINQP